MFEESQVIDTNAPILLMVDDHPKNLQVLGAILRKFNYNIAVARSGQQAIDFVSSVIPDLILLDIMMPQMDGFEVCERLKQDERTAGIPIIFVTALDSHQDKLRGFASGGVDYITKPFHQEEVVARVKAQLTIQQQRKELSHTNTRLKEANITRDRLFQIIAHDLLGPVANVAEVLKLLNYETLTPVERAEFTQGALLSVQQTHSLLKNLLYWAKSQNQEIDCNPSRSIPSQTAEECITLLSGQAKEKEIALHNLIPTSLIINADVNMLTTIFRNLISNAIKYSNSGTIVKIGIEDAEITPNDQVVFYVQDFGVGIDPSNIEKILDPQLHFSTPGTKYEKGVGLGLSLCIDFIHRHGGELKVTSELGKGSKFSFSLPR